MKAVLDHYSEQEPEYYTELSDAYLTAGNIDVAEKLLKKAKSISPESMFQCTFCLHCLGNTSSISFFLAIAKIVHLY